MFRKNLFLSILIWIMAVNINLCQAGGGIKDSSFLYGARPMALSGAFTAVEGDLNSINFNPAGIAGIKKNILNTFYTNPLQVSWIRQYHIGIGMPMKLREFDMVNALSYSAVDLNHEYEFNSGTNPLAYKETAIIYSAGLKLNKQSLIGINLGYNRVNGSVTGLGAKGISFDAGYLGKFREDVSFGISLKNLYNRKKWDSGISESKALEYRLGMKYDCYDRLALMGDLVGTGDETLKTFNAGAEFTVWESVKVSDEMRGQQYFKRSSSKLYPENLAFLIRFGLEKDFYFEKNMRYSAGLGFGIGMTKLDYAFKIDNKGANNNQHYFSLGLEFGNDISKEYEEDGDNAATQPPLPQQPAGLKQSSPQKTSYKQYSQKPSQSRRLEMGVVNFTNVLNNRPYQWLTAGIPDMIIKGVEVKKNIGFRDRKELSDMVSLVTSNTIYMNGEVASQIGVLVNADYILVGWYEIRNEKELTVSFRLFNTDRRTEILNGSVKGTVMQVFALIGQINDAVANAIK